ncbi:MULTISPECIES: VOC family protein [unclassified Streptomyces]|uniref:VOC family protein n=1 Tax=Streptomyces TaxID=1883 RepID=UPI0001C18B6F|nr:MULTISPECIES: VOC family protein [unclassified Streptomyces]AEN13280.1 Glyoxalase/bleomycin resistance protein/dioxygenase [Streptomyces sp. SirexAA-E]MYR65275.1 glyoxalase/bleomycin resistance/dioxygenase family protein [Streptomyces sp. SID4939]MYS04837.1 glyoxalase/bleomycin resistance/dioxygenase family protein [Streptomyces sp. SID4940]MYT67270.1 glyoxalase/bleomycin resistance/dioxygenase family protein [Streptomyces sp. SID8357]MYT88044.1 glyoxalase/bleomycin resistance/dioxygenase f
MPADATAHLRIARPSRDLEAAEVFWVAGLGLDVLYRHEADGTSGEHALLMVGWPDASWHLELVRDPAAPVDPRPTPEDLLVVYLGEPVPDSLTERLERHGGKRVPAHNPYWDTWGVTFQDPDGYLLVLSTRTWSNS